MGRQEEKVRGEADRGNKSDHGEYITYAGRLQIVQASDVETKARTEQFVYL